MIYLFATMGQAWNVLGGYTGQFSFGHSLFFGLGAYVSTLLYLKLGITPWIGILISCLSGIALGLFIGALSFRYGLKGPFFALIMLAFAEIFHMITMGWNAVGGSPGLLIPLKGNAPHLMQFTSKQPFYYMALWMMVGSLYLVWRLEKTRTGLCFLSVREDHDAAEALGVDTFKVQMIAMAISAGLTAMIGTIYAQYLLFIDPDSTFGILNSVEIMVRPIIGGPGTVLGPLLGSVVLTPLAEITRLAFQSYSGVYLMWYGMILVIVIMFLPHGLMGMIWQIIDKYRKG
jgi:branched-chain amino acid transport system permease protein